MIATTAETIVREFWRLMATNDFAAVAEVLSDDFVLEWPQSRERIRGAANFSLMNDEYVSHGIWRFTVNRVIATDNEAVSDVAVTDGVQIGRALSFFTISNGRITKIVEFWPDPFPAPQNRAHVVETMQ